MNSQDQQAALCPLSERPIGFQGSVRGLAGEAQKIERLQELGFVSGESISIQGVSPFGDPMIVQVRGAIVALRRSEAKCIRT
jgi:ferrous iron transport protein A